LGAPELAIDVDEETGIWRTDGVPMIYLPRHFLVNNHKATEAALGREPYAAMIRKATDKSAFDWCTMQSQRSDASREDIFRLYFARLSQRGWGRFSIELLDEHKRTSYLKLCQSVFVLEEHQKSTHSLCYMFEGFATGAMRFLLGERQKAAAFQCHEVQCAGQGDHSFCRFVVEDIG
jgi:Domain of unknown function (DUF5943)/V4R domain